MNEKIPNIFHFVYGLKKQKKPFPLYHYLCIESCRKVNNPDKIILYYHYLPYGKYWELIKKRVELVFVNLNPFLNKFNYSIKNRGCKKFKYAHHSDFIRLEALLNTGGVYADIDTIFVNKLSEHLFHKEFVLGRENDIVDQRTNTRRESLCNAFIMSKPNSEFCKIWLNEMYNKFDGSWSAHSTLLPMELSKKYPRLLHIEEKRSFYSFMWTKNDLDLLLKKQCLDWTGIYNIHLWSHLWDSRKRLDFCEFHSELITEEFIYEVDTTYSLLCRSFLPAKNKTEFDVSVIIPTRNRPKFLFNSVVSVLAQTLPPCEIIIYDDCSDEKFSEEIKAVSKLSHKISLISGICRRGRSYARNHSAEQAKGKYIHFIDDDDLVHPDFYRQVCDTFKRKKCSVVVTGYNYFHLAHPDIHRKYFYKAPYPSKLIEQNPEEYIMPQTLPINSIVMERSITIRCKFLEDFFVGEDIIFFIEVAKKYPNWAKIDERLAFVRRHAGNTSRINSYLKEQQRLLEYLIDSQDSKTKKENALLKLRLLKNSIFSLKIPRLRIMFSLMKEPHLIVYFVYRACKRRIFIFFDFVLQKIV